MELSLETSTSLDLMHGQTIQGHNRFIQLPPNSRYPELILQPDSCPISQEQLAAEVKGIYAGITMVEAKCIDMDATQAANPESLPGFGQWQALIALHRTLLYEHHDFIMVRGPAAKYSMPVRMWKHGIHVFLEVLRHRRPESQQFMLNFICLAYQMMSSLYETTIVHSELQSDWLDFALPSLIRSTLETLTEYVNSATSSAGSVLRHLLRNHSRNRRLFWFVASLATSSSFSNGALAERHDGIGPEFENPQLSPDTGSSTSVIDILLSLVPFAILTAGLLSAVWTLLSGHASFPSRLCNSNFTSMLTIVLSLASWVLAETISDMSRRTEQLIQSTLFLWLALWLNYVVLRCKRVSDNVTFLWATLVTTVVVSLSCATYAGSDLGARSPVSGIVIEALRFGPVCATGSSMLFARFLSCRPRNADADLERDVAMTRRRAWRFTLC